MCGTGATFSCRGVGERFEKMEEKLEERFITKQILLEVDCKVYWKDFTNESQNHSGANDYCIPSTKNNIGNTAWVRVFPGAPASGQPALEPNRSEPFRSAERETPRPLYRPLYLVW